MVNHNLLLQSIAQFLSLFRLPSQRRRSSTKNLFTDRSPSMSTQSTSCLDGYRITGILGSGGNGVVLEAASTHAVESKRHSEHSFPGTSTQQRFAVKCSAPGDDASAAVLEVRKPPQQACKAVPETYQLQLRQTAGLYTGTAPYRI